MVCMDYYSKWPEIADVDGISSDQIITKLGKIFGRLGYPKTLVSDNDKQMIFQKTTKCLIVMGLNREEFRFMPQIITV